MAQITNIDELCMSLRSESIERMSSYRDIDSDFMSLTELAENICKVIPFPINESAISNLYEAAFVWELINDFIDGPIKANDIDAPLVISGSIIEKIIPRNLFSMSEHELDRIRLKVLDNY